MEWNLSFSEGKVEQHDCYNNRRDVEHAGYVSKKKRAIVRDVEQEVYVFEN